MSSDEREQFVAATETVATGLQRTLDRLWERDDAVDVVEGFLRGEVELRITRDTMHVRFTGEDDTGGRGSGSIGMYL